jgi:Homeodomain-like domain
VDKNAAMAERGRPSKLTPERLDDLVVLLAARVPVEVAARSVGVSRRTLDRWLRQEELRERVAHARAAGPEGADALTEARLVVLLLRAASVDWKASAWFLERRYPKHWGPARIAP